ncbi:MAG: hypothetical protein QMD92_04120 [bacterium]|nr:hypothetical protein [bacterium]
MNSKRLYLIFTLAILISTSSFAEVGNIYTIAGRIIREIFT